MPGRHPEPRLKHETCQSPGGKGNGRMYLVAIWSPESIAKTSTVSLEASARYLPLGEKSAESACLEARRVSTST